MNYFLILFFYSSSLLAQEICGQRVTDEKCFESLKEAIFFKKDNEVQKVINKRGIQILLYDKDQLNSFNIFKKAFFFNRTPIFKMLSKSPGYPDFIPDKNKFLRSLIGSTVSSVQDAEIINILFLNDSKEKRLEWWVNPNWPYPLFQNFKNNNKDKKKSQDLIALFDQMDDLKRNICQIDTLDKLKETIRKFNGIEVIFKNSQHDLLTCAVDRGNIELASYLVEHDLFYPANLSGLEKKYFSGPPSEENLTMLRVIEIKRKALNLPTLDKKIQQSLWFINNSNDATLCSQEEHLSLNSFAAMARNIVFSTLLEECRILKNAQESQNIDQKRRSTAKIIELISLGEIPMDFQDSQGKTIMHHLAAFADSAIILEIENRFNTTSLEANPYLIQDKQGNTPLHISLINKNMSGAQVLADKVVYAKDGLSMGLNAEIILTNNEGKTPLAIVKELKVPENDRKKLREIKKLINDNLKSLKEFTK